MIVLNIVFYKKQKAKPIPPVRTLSEFKNGLVFCQGFTPLGVAKHPWRVAKRLLNFHEVYGAGLAF